MSQTQQVRHEDSIETQDPHNEDAKKTKSRRPANTAFRQQRLKAWQPILTPKTVLPLFFIVGILFAPIGGLLIWASSQVQELAIDYTDCFTKSPETLANRDPNKTDTTAVMPASRVTSHFKTAGGQPPKWGHATEKYNYSSQVSLDTNVCVLQFDIPNDIHPPILFYYRLTNFYQNHRRYVKSIDTDQLKGDAKSASAINSGDCDPLQLDPETKLPYYPCGLIANSLFNDTFDNFTAQTQDEHGKFPIYNLTQKGIAWSSEADLYGKTKYTAKEVAVPPNWRLRYPKDGYTDERGIPDLHTDEAFQVWMRTAGLPTFSKLAARNDHDVLKAGTYRIKIWENFEVSEYGGTKSILISTRTVMGGKNPFLGIAYVVVGGICILLGALFTATHLIKPRKLGDHTYLTWNNDQPSTATATGRSVRPGDSA
ncbi:Lem3/Cdc50 [Mytilinidion resinicola]|uniref:Lem3/Cdc50 n=1 Tax=Mytilinidion resinicola TaxID=574789 RepID=A0A6A6YPC3_9PEZI|nr:Lem3/Cdc50 [Mytilinidion resinicola]KAF2810746.1 Lem3/Cdc50 [Mytilinidion resinicola]